MNMKENVLIIGGGPAGSASAMNLLQKGFSPTIIESESFPRYHIGESLTTECVDALNRLGLSEQLQALKAPQKQGVRVFSKHPENSFYIGAGDAWQVERATFDTMMLNEAQKRGAKHIQAKVKKLTQQTDNWILELDNGQSLESRFVIDASGQQRLSHKQGLFGPIKDGTYQHQVAFFAQYHGIKRKNSDQFDTLIFHIDSHAWCWMIPLSEDVTSIGLVVPVDQYKQKKLKPDLFMDHRLSNFSLPMMERTKDATRISEVRTMSNYSYCIDEYCRDGLFCVGDSHRFIDPIFSFGVEFAVVEAAYVARAIEKCCKTPSKANEHHHEYMQCTTQAQNIIEDILAYFWAHPWGFANMAHFRHADEFLEIFAGRIYETEPGEGLLKVREELQQ